MPCRCDWDCPTCGQSTTNEKANIGRVVNSLERKYHALREHHIGLEERVERAEELRDSAEKANVRAQEKVKEASHARDMAVARMEEMEQMKNGARDLWLNDFSDDELLDEIARRRT